MTAPTAYPLQWPAGRPRTRTRQEGRFSTTMRCTNRATMPVTIAEARQRLQDELGRIGARLPVLSTNVELTLNGHPRSGTPQPSDPGVAVYFQIKQRPMVMACDRFREVAQNIAAIAGHIEATRRIDRYGVATTEQMFAGFLALPAPMVVDDWRTPLDDPKSLAEAEVAYRRKMRSAHPDQGGSSTDASRLNAAIASARKAMG